MQQNKVPAMAVLPPDPKYLLRSDMECVHSILFRVKPVIELLYAGNSTGKVYIWDLRKNRELLQLTSGDDSCLSLLNTSDDTLLVQQKCGVVNAFKPVESDWILEKSVDIDFCHYCRFQILSESEVLVPMRNSKIGILSLKTYEIEAKLSPVSLPSCDSLGEVMVIKPVKKDSGRVLVAYEGGQLLLWDIKQQSVLSSLEIEPCSMALDYDSYFRRGIIGGPSDQLHIFDLSDNHKLSTRNKITLKNAGTAVASIRQDSKIAAMGGWDSRVRVYSWKNMRPLAVLDQHKGTVHDIAFSTEKVQAYDNKALMATAAKDGCVALWDIYN